MYRTPVSPLPICDASLILWLSPPESVAEALDRVRYSRPTFRRKLSLAFISFIIVLAMNCSLSVSSREDTNLRASLTLRSENSLIFRPPTVTARENSLSLLPPQTGQGLCDIQASMSALIESLLVSL